MLKAIVIVSFLFSTLSLVGVIAPFVYFNNLHQKETTNIDKNRISQEQWNTEFSKWRDDISGYVSSLYEKHPTSASEQQNLPIGIGL